MRFSFFACYAAPGSSILGRKLAQFYTVYHFALIRVSDRKELHFAARYSDLRNWYISKSLKCSRLHFRNPIAPSARQKLRIFLVY